MKTANINKSVTELNDSIAKRTLSSLNSKGIFCINILGSPGSGKTTFIEGISRFIKPSEIAVIQGDLESDIDKIRLEKSGIHSHQINTHSGCHLNAAMIDKALSEMDITGKKYLLIENVGNLVCPAGVKVGQHMNIVVSSTTEGSDKPKKYPLVFAGANLILISKYDLAAPTGFDEKFYTDELIFINSRAKIVKTSSKKEDSFREAAQFIMHERERLLGTLSIPPFC